MTQPTIPLDTIYTADEAAARLRLHKRGLIKFARDIGACSRYGRTYLFSEQDILDIWQALRAPPINYHGRAVHIPAHESPVNLHRRLEKFLVKKPKRKAATAESAKRKRDREERVRRRKEWAKSANPDRE